jgi:hypothetical protein
MATNFEKLSISPEFAGMLTALKAYDEALGKFADALRLAYGDTRGEEMFNDTFCSFIPGEEAIKKEIADWLDMRVGEINIKSL